LKSIRIILFSIFIFASSERTQGQVNSILGHFYASEENGVVILSWEILTGSTCNGIQIFRSTDDLNYVQINDIPGICGNISFAQDYIYEDSNPVKNKTNFYKLKLGTSGYSPVISVEIIDINKSGYQIRPNPVRENSKIYFTNEMNSESLISIYDFNGAEVYTNMTYNNYFNIDRSLFNSGFYIFSISITGNFPNIRGKLLVL
jgi:hypothetical protein